MTVASFALMTTFSNEQVRYSQVAEETSNLQVQRLLEKLSVTIQDGQVHMKNTGSIPVQVKEIRILNNDGDVILQEKAEQTIHVSQTGTIQSSPRIERALQEIITQ